MKRALVIEDDVAIRGLIEWCLKTDGWQTEVAADGLEGLEKAESQNPHLIILDLILPRLYGTDFLRRLREWSKAWVIVVSQMTDVENKIKLLQLGADDYLIKPFDCSELRAHIQAASRRIGTDTASPAFGLSYDDIEVDFRAVKVTVSGIEIKLTPHEFLTLKMLMSHIGTVVNTKTILNEVWADAFAKPNQLQVVITNLRHKLGVHRDWISNVHGVGYKFLRQPEQPAVVS